MAQEHAHNRREYSKTQPPNSVSNVLEHSSLGTAAATTHLLGTETSQLWLALGQEYG